MIFSKSGLIQILCFRAGKPDFTLNLHSNIWLHMQITVKNRLIIQLTIGLAMLVASITNAQQVIEAPTQNESNVDETYSEISEQVLKLKTTEEVIAEHFKDTPIMKKIAYCESHNRQFNENGSVLRGYVNSQDVGVMQINEKYHLADSKKLGYDIHTLEGNIDYAKHLYKTQGVRPWIHSSHCWDPSNQFALR
jgi:hypothetical protein